MTTRTGYIEKTKTRLDKLDRELTKLTVCVDAAKGDLKQELEIAINDINQSKRTLENKIVRATVGE